MMLFLSFAFAFLPCCCLFLCFCLCDVYRYRGGVRLFGLVDSRGRRKKRERGKAREDEVEVEKTLAVAAVLVPHSLSLSLFFQFVPSPSLAPPFTLAALATMASSMLRPLPTMRTVTPARRGAVQVRSASRGEAEFNTSKCFWWQAKQSKKGAKKKKQELALLLLLDRAPPPPVLPRPACPPLLRRGHRDFVLLPASGENWPASSPLGEPETLECLLIESREQAKFWERAQTSLLLALPLSSALLRSSSSSSHGARRLKPLCSQCGLNWRGKAGQERETARRKMQNCGELFEFFFSFRPLQRQERLPTAKKKNAVVVSSIVFSGSGFAPLAPVLRSISCRRSGENARSRSHPAHRKEKSRNWKTHDRETRL